MSEIASKSRNVYVSLSRLTVDRHPSFVAICGHFRKMDFSHMVTSTYDDLQQVPYAPYANTPPHPMRSRRVNLLLFLPLLVMSTFLSGCELIGYNDTSGTHETDRPTRKGDSSGTTGDFYSAQDKSRRYVRTDRYKLTNTEPAAEQIEPLLTHISISFGEHIKTIGHALFELLRGSGYQILYTDTYACKLSAGLLFNRELPLALRTLGPVTLGSALETLIGKAWEVRVSELGRTLAFYVREEYADVVSAQDIDRTASASPQVNHAHSRFSITFDTGAFHVLSDSAHGVIMKAAARIKKMNATVLVRGHAHSSGHWATESQALRRAKTVRETLLRAGVDAGVMRLDTSVSNNNDPLRQLLNGVELFLYVPTSGHVPVSTISQLDCASTHNQPVAKNGQSATGPAVFTVHSGSLRRNIERLLRVLGLRMGKWDLADGRYEYDWEIPHGYTIPVTTPDQAMRSLLSSYGIQPILNLLDNSVDFVMYHKPVPGRP